VGAAGGRTTVKTFASVSLESLGALDAAAETIRASVPAKFLDPSAKLRERSATARKGEISTDVYDAIRERVKKVWQP
jgi:hypothetical protein